MGEISDKTRKRLWAKSGNKCSICKTPLFVPHTATVDFNVGEECHIISSQTTGPRHKPGIDDYNDYSNLILLCRNHHKEIDDLPDAFTEDVLRFMKATHENWVSTTLSSASKEKDKTPKPEFLVLITSGQELFGILNEAHGYKTSYDEPKSREEAEFFADTLQNITDYGEVSTSLEIGQKVMVEFELTELINQLREKGYVLYGVRQVGKYKAGNIVMDNINIAMIIIRRIADIVAEGDSK